MCSKVLIFLSVANLFGVRLCQRGDSMLSHLAANAYSSDASYCRIPVRDLIATAESATNRVLQGICNPRELNERFTTLENQIVDQFNVLKTMILNIEDKLRDQDEKIKGQHRKLHRAFATFRKMRRGFKESAPGIVASKLTATKKSGDAGENSVYDYYDDEEESDNFTEEEDFKTESPSPRAPEISLYNSTIHIEDGKRAFTYYWTVRDIPYRTKNWGWRRSLRSESFYIFQHGYRMYMRVFPNQNGKNIYIHVGVTKGEYDETLEWPFKLKHKIQVVDHYPHGKDLSSRVWDPTQLCSGWNWKKPDGDNYECVGLGFRQETVYSRRYLHDDSITIKLTVFID